MAFFAFCQFLSILRFPYLCMLMRFFLYLCTQKRKPSAHETNSITAGYMSDEPHPIAGCASLARSLEGTTTRRIHDYLLHAGRRVLASVSHHRRLCHRPRPAGQLSLCTTHGQWSAHPGGLATSARCRHAFDSRGDVCQPIK